MFLCVSATESFSDNFACFSFSEETAEYGGFFLAESLFDFHNRNGLSIVEVEP
jgi:hypothetical protein